MFQPFCDTETKMMPLELVTGSSPLARTHTLYRWSLHVGLGSERASSSGAGLQQYRAAVLSPGDRAQRQGGSCSCQEGA